MYIDKDVYYGDIVDILASNNFVFKELIFRAILIIKEHLGGYANIWMTDQEHRNLLYDIGFFDSKNVTHFGMRINGKIEVSNNIQKYYLTMSDSDVF